MLSNKNVPIYNALINHIDKKMSSFHTPGHKNIEGLLPEDLLKFDLTELPDTDSLFDADSSILKAEELTARLLGIKRSLFSAGGCTLCIQAMLRLVCPNAGKIIVGRTIHKSAINTMALLDINPVWVFPKRNAGKYLPGRIDACDIETKLKENPDAKAVYITSPDYYGVMCDIGEISSICKKYNVPLIVDNAHGSHLFFMKDKLHPIELGADMTACSAHKTLPVLTGGAWLNIANDKFVDDAKSAMALFGSTSPSYPVMASLDICRAWLEENAKQEFCRLEDRVKKIKQLIDNKGLMSPKGLSDPIRISFSAVGFGFSGKEIAELLRGAKIEPEYADEAYIVLIATPMNTEEDFLRLENFIIKLKPKNQPLKLTEITMVQPNIKLSPRQAILSTNKTIKISDSLGKIACETLCPCPPGIPIIMPGELITKECIQILSNYGLFNIKVVL